jgi:phytoene dehydrogenase-like protein
MLKSLFRFALVLMTGLVMVGCSSPATEPSSAVSSEDALAVFIPRKALRVAVVGAGPSGLTAADTLKKLGYEHVTVFEKNNRVGGKVYSFKSGSNVSELGAVFASPDYTLTLGLADKYGIPYEAYNTNQAILDENGKKVTTEEFLTSRYSTLELLGATAKYAGVLALFSGIQRNGLAYQLPDLQMPFDKFAAKYGITPIAELIRSVMIGFGYGYYETAPAAYYMKLLPWLVKLGGPKGLQQAQYYTFPTGYQSIWEAVAKGLDVRLNSEVTSITRRSPLTGSAVQIAVNGGAKEDFDVVIISAPLNKVSKFMALSSAEQELFSQVESERYFVSLFGATGLTPSEVLFFHGNARPSGINHINVWANRDATTPFVGYQIAEWGPSNASIGAILADDVAGQGGTFRGLLLQQEWDYFPHVAQSAMQSGFYERIEARQGNQNTFYVGGTLSFETVEHSARYAEELVKKNFPPVYF